MDQALSKQLKQITALLSSSPLIESKDEDLRAEVEGKMKPLEEQTSIARLRAAQAAHSVDGLEKWLQIIKNRQDEQSELLKRVLEDRARSGHTSGRHHKGRSAAARTQSDFSGTSSRCNGADRRSRSPLSSPEIGEDEVSVVQIVPKQRRAHSAHQACAQTSPPRERANDRHRSPSRSRGGRSDAMGV